MTTPPPPTIPPHGAPSVSRDARHNRRPGRFALSPRVPEHRGSAPMTIARLLASVALATMLAMPASAQTIEDAARARVDDDVPVEIWRSSSTRCFRWLGQGEVRAVRNYRTSIARRMERTSSATSRRRSIASRV